MRKKTSKKPLSGKSSAKKGKKRARSGKRIAVIFTLIGFLVLAELISFAVNQAGASKEFPVQKTLEFSGDTQPCGAFKAWDVLALPNEIVVSDQDHKRLLIFDQQGKFMSEIGQKQAGPPDITEVSGLTSDPSGNIYVMDTWSTRIRGFNPKGDSILNLNFSDKGFYGPRGAAWDNNSFVIADTGSHRVAKVSLDGNIVAAWGSHGSGKGMFNNPIEVALDGQGNYDVVDQGNNRIQSLDSQGHFVREIGVGAAPSSEAIDLQRKLLFVASNDGHFVKVYTLKGKFVGNMIEPGKKDSPLPDFRALSVMDNGDLVASNETKVFIYHPVATP
jgi:DNA-binding beta-propeller fold protein YncE